MLSPLFSDRDKGAVDAMFKALRRDLPKQLELNVSNPEKQIRILTGTEEGIDAWITVNYLEGTLGTVSGLFLLIPAYVPRFLV